MNKSNSDIDSLQTWETGTFKQQFKYRSFMPSLINKPYYWNDRRIDLLLSEAMRYLGELNAYSLLVPDVDYFIKMHIYKEATTSSKIEGTKTNIEEAMLSEDDIHPEKRDDWAEVQNYVNAINFSVNELKNLPLSMRLVKKTHEKLLSGVRGYSKMPGEIRQSQNWIGGSSLIDAAFIPPHQDDLPELLSDLEHFWHNEALEMPDLIKVALTHYQFETIHPFLDGNGRSGRLLIALQLIDRGILHKPTLYISDFFEKNRTAYYDALSLVRESNKIDDWIRFFLHAVSVVAKQGRDTFARIIVLRKHYEEVIHTRISPRRQAIARDLLLHLFSQPILTISDVADACNITFQTASLLVKEFSDAGILVETTGFSKNRIYSLQEYVHLFTKGQEESHDTQQ